MTYTVITTFNSEGYNTYAQKMLQTFLATWPKQVELWAYAESCRPKEQAANLKIFDLEASSPELVAFKNRWRNVPKANGHPHPGAESKAYKWQAVRFSHKVYAIFAAAKAVQTEWLIWMDADMVCHSPLPIQRLSVLFPSDKDLCYAGRSNKFTECGLYGMNLTQPMIKKFLDEFQRMYDEAEQGIFTLSEWHDSYVFDQVRSKFPLRKLNWTANLINGEGHPIINCEWGAYLDHLKGKRKKHGRSNITKDLVVKRTEAYWR